MISKLANHLWPLFYRARFYADVPAVLQLLKFRELRQSYFHAMWREAAQAVGASCADAGFGYFRIDRGGLTAFVKNSEVSLDSHLMLDMMGNKPLTHALLDEMGVSVPKAMRFTMRELPEAEAFLVTCGRPIVVKPASGTGGGRGVTTHISDAAGLRRAASYASRFDRAFFAEEFVEGQSYRLLYLNGELIDAVRRDSPILTGDGASSIRQLIKAENRKRLQGDPVTALSPLKADRDCLQKLKRQGKSLSTVLRRGETIAVKQAVNENDASGNRALKSAVDPGTIALGRRIVTRIGVELAGLDLICKDISQPLEDGNGCFNEINTTPGLHHHALIANPEDGVPVAKLVLEHMFKTRRGIMILGGEPRRFQPVAQAEMLAG